jgi:hypothetical protein
LLPNTALAKDQALPSLAELGKVADLFSHAGWLLTAVTAMCAGMALASGGLARRTLAAPPVVLILALLAYGALKQDWMPYYRFATPVWPLATLIAVLAVPKALMVLSRRARGVVVVLMAAGLVATGTRQLSVAKDFRASPTVPLCKVADKTGRGFNGLAEVLGRPSATLLTPDLSGSSLTSNLRLVDLAGLVSPKIAAYWADDDMAGLRDYVFERARPTFVTLSSSWVHSTHLLADPRMRQEYYPLKSQGHGVRCYVRKDAVRSPSQLAALRAYQHDLLMPAIDRDKKAPRRGCGALEVGQQLQPMTR